MTLSELKTAFHSALSTEFPSEEIDSFFFWLLEDFLGMKRLNFALNHQIEISREDEDKMKNALLRLQNFEPVQYITGATEFYGFPFKVSEAVLIPRPETEELVSLVLSESQSFEKPKILDIGTGSGCIAISLAKNLPDAEVTALDVSEDALKVTRENIGLNAVNVQVVQADILQTKTLPAQFDIIVSNPPYVRHLEKKMMKGNVLNYEPDLALFVTDEDPLIFYKKIAELAKDNLSEKGKLFFEINEYLGNELVAFLEASGFNNIRLHKDFAEKDRMISCSRRD